jgi:DNA-binding NarL/FixJ family response regulator
VDLHTVAQRAIRVLIADDHPLIRLALREELQAAKFDVCAEAATGAEAFEAALRDEPDICLLDASMPEGGGLGAATAIHEQLPLVKVVLITATPSERDSFAALCGGADGYIAKDVDPHRLPTILRAVVAGELAYPRSLLRQLLKAAPRTAVERSET